MSQNNQLAQSTDTAFTKEDAYRTLEMINTWISNIDTKVSFALSIAGVLIGFVFSKGLPSAFKRIGEVSKLAELSGGEIIAAIFVGALYIVSFISILYFMLVILARIKNSSNVQSIFFFGSVANQNLLDYRTKLNQMSEKDIIEDLEEQIHTNSMICSKKTKYYNIGVKCLVVYLILWFICMSFGLI